MSTTHRDTRGSARLAAFAPLTLVSAQEAAAMSINAWLSLGALGMMLHFVAKDGALRQFELRPEGRAGAASARRSQARADVDDAGGDRGRRSRAAQARQSGSARADAPWRRATITAALAAERSVGAASDRRHDVARRSPISRSRVRSQTRRVPVARARHRSSTCTLISRELPPLRRPRYPAAMRGLLLLLGPLLASVLLQRERSRQRAHSNAAPARRKPQRSVDERLEHHCRIDTSAVRRRAARTAAPRTRRPAATAMSGPRGLRHGNDTPCDGCSGCRASGTLLWLERPSGPTLRRVATAWRSARACSRPATCRLRRLPPRLDLALRPWQRVPDWRYDHEATPAAASPRSRSSTTVGSSRWASTNNTVSWSATRGPAASRRPASRTREDCRGPSTPARRLRRRRGDRSDLVFLRVGGAARGLSDLVRAAAAVIVPVDLVRVQTYSGVWADGRLVRIAVAKPASRDFGRPIARCPTAGSNPAARLRRRDRRSADLLDAARPQRCPVVVAVDDSGNTWLCRTDDDDALPYHAAVGHLGSRDNAARRCSAARWAATRSSPSPVAS